ncbi:MAG: hypothetical protein MJZ27_11025 [Bacteroidales bacterium]|nr:hypothetical protein [Bacteroidales bacterium]
MKSNRCRTLASTKPVAQINGSLCHITATFGNAIAGIIINHIIDKNTKE